MTRFQTQLAPLDSLGRVLPQLLQNLSIARAQIAMDQLGAMVDEKLLDRIIFATASSPQASENPLAAAIALHHSRSDGRVGDMATVIHAGLVQPSAVTQSSSIVPALSSTLDRELHGRGVRFVQWATDASDAADDSVSHWCQGLGFQQIGTLDYLSAPVPQPAKPMITGIENQCLRFEPVELGRSSEFQRFAELVERTYTETLDCPGLAEYRTASQTLGGYQAAGAFDPRLWFNVYDDHDSPVGCMVLASHRPRTTPGNDASSSVVIEIVYMGLVPEARGRGRGRALVQRALDAASGVGADRLILGVDQRNRFARAIYEEAGLRPMLSETVWVKSLDVANP